jgi:hypothetical protein
MEISSIIRFVFIGAKNIWNKSSGKNEALIIVSSALFFLKFYGFRDN